MKIVKRYKISGSKIMPASKNHPGTWDVNIAIINLMSYDVQLEDLCPAALYHETHGM